MWIAHRATAVRLFSLVVEALTYSDRVNSPASDFARWEVRLRLLGGERHCRIRELLSLVVFSNTNE
jgi:hypothetical protein